MSVKISELPQADTPLTGSEVLAIVQDATTKKVTVNETAWGLNGNSGTNPATNFLGTTDNQSLSIRTNNTEVLLIDNGGNITLNSGGDFIVSDGGVSNVDINQQTISITDAGESISITTNGVQKIAGEFSLDVDTLKIPKDAGANKVLTSDSLGVATWSALNVATYNLSSYVNDAAADADTGLPSGGLYKLNAGRAIYQKP